MSGRIPSSPFFPMIAIVKEISKCFKCGMCRAVCPVLQAVEIETAGPRAKVAVCEALAAGRLKATSAVLDILGRCTGCRACSLNCTSETDPYALAILTRFEHERGECTLPRPSGPVSAFLNRVLSGRGKSLEGIATRKKKPARVGYFAGCAEMDHHPRILENVLGALEALGIQVVVPAEQVCCGWPHILAGRLEEARGLAMTNRKAFEGIDIVLASCPHCVMTLSHEYPALLRTRAFENRTRDILHFLVEKKLDSRLTVHRDSRGVLFSHPCRMGRYRKKNMTYLEFLKRRLDSALVVQDSAGCCGAPLELAYPATAKLMLRRKMEEIVRVGNAKIVSCCPFCIMAIGSALRVKVEHVFEGLKVRG